MAKLRMMASIVSPAEMLQGSLLFKWSHQQLPRPFQLHISNRSQGIFLMFLDVRAQTGFPLITTTQL
jgi:hypothetical protein